jgi:hypothetical protein
LARVVDNPSPDSLTFAGLLFPVRSTKRFQKCGGSHYNERIASMQIGAGVRCIPHGRICAAVAVFTTALAKFSHCLPNRAPMYKRH